MLSYSGIKELNESIMNKKGKNLGLIIDFRKTKIPSFYNLTLVTSKGIKVCDVNLFVLNTCHRMHEATYDYMCGHSYSTDELYETLLEKRIFNAANPVWFVIEETIHVYPKFRRFGIATYIQNNLSDIVEHYLGAKISYTLLVSNRYLSEKEDEYGDMLYKHYTRLGFRGLSKGDNVFLIKHNPKYPWAKVWEYADNV